MKRQKTDDGERGGGGGRGEDPSATVFLLNQGGG